MTSDRAAGARAAAGHAARASRARLLALLAAGTRDLALAEDALQGAFEEALARWPQAGVPENPEGWLLAVARNRQRDAWRSAAVRTAAPLEDGEEGAAVDPLAELDPDAIPDRRLALLFTCAHPAIDAGVRTPLMLQTVLGFEAAQVARVFAVPAPTMAQRLVRAKRRIRDAGIPFRIPERREMPERLPGVLEAVYGCFAIAWADADGAGPDAAESMAGEALHLAVALAALLEDEPEAWGLASLVALSLSRAGSRTDAFVPLEEQDPAGWDAALVADGEALLRRAGAASSPHPPGRFELEAAMQAVHADRARTAATDWPALETLSSALLAVAPTLGARVAHAAILGRTRGPDAGLEALRELASAAPADFQPLHAARAELLARAGREEAARAAFRRAAELAPDERSRAYLAGRAGWGRARPVS
ncbi:RNA polymerase sigma factor [Homoserinibacter sp. YIM 151385]|uniref:RNA polymerase sigma factor n=1 Tax=Homoserinibacter sp. YIM 151385 TaxID=2985506 RepID=UPI0022F0F3F3|nr:DUF6596 domain-containing protein [Homoserinibacter sp. YIM 151385]WBU37213.1 sigma factor [Homoserinibacter sp. YIM 151385]